MGMENSSGNNSYQLNSASVEEMVISNDQMIALLLGMMRIRCLEETLGTIAGFGPVRTFIRDSQLTVRPDWSGATPGAPELHTEETVGWATLSARVE